LPKPRPCCDAGVRPLGPNCQGLVDLRSGLTATFSPAVLTADRSSLAPAAYVGQSGAVGGVFFDMACARVHPDGLGSTGNEMDVSAAEVATEFAGAGDFDLLCLYLEKVPAGQAWFDLLDAAADPATRVAVLRSGRSRAGRLAAKSHTGALVENDAAFDLSCAEAGILLANDVSDLVIGRLAARVVDAASCARVLVTYRRLGPLLGCRSIHLATCAAALRLARAGESRPAPGSHDALTVVPGQVA
jgi:acetate---CoA ligase (ADP-forming)